MFKVCGGYLRHKHGDLHGLAPYPRGSHHDHSASNSESRLTRDQSPCQAAGGSGLSQYRIRWGRYLPIIKLRGLMALEMASQRPLWAGACTGDPSRSSRPSCPCFLNIWRLTARLCGGCCRGCGPWQWKAIIGTSPQSRSGRRASRSRVKRGEDQKEGGRGGERRASDGIAMLAVWKRAASSNLITLMRTETDQWASLVSSRWGKKPFQRPLRKRPLIQVNNPLRRKVGLASCSRSARKLRRCSRASTATVCSPTIAIPVRSPRAVRPQ